ncbi:MAG: DUF2071 domain-containing protein [Planctomycetaceae bacterium]
MNIPAIRGIIDRRILANYRIDPDVMAAHLPKPFRPQLVNGYSIAGICLIRLKQVRPRFFPIPWGFGSENAAHRIAVEWETEGKIRSGVYVPRRDTSSRLNALAGGRLFPGLSHHATFRVTEEDVHFSVEMKSDDGHASVHLSGSVDDTFPEDSVFGSLEKASAFFESGSLGYSDSRVPKQYHGLELRCTRWQTENLAIHAMNSSFFEDAHAFPAGSVEFDCALLMRNIPHEWHAQPSICCDSVV